MPDRDKPRLVRVAGRSDWHIYWWDDAGRHRVSTGTKDRAEAERALVEHAARLERAALPAALGIASILDKYLADRRDAEIPGLDRLVWAHKPLRRFWGERPPTVITKEECRKYRRERAKDASGPHGRPAGPSTVRTELQALRAALNWAKAKKLIAELPEIEFPPRPEARERWLRRDEAKRLQDACERPHIRLFIELALRTAARTGAILDLTWDRVDLDQERIHYRVPDEVETSKKRVTVPINETLLPFLKAAFETSSSTHVIEWASKPVKSIKHGLRETAKRAGLKGVSAHVLRHTAATWMAQEGVPLWEIAGMLGHSDTTMVSRTYGHHHPDHMARAAKALA